MVRGGRLTGVGRLLDGMAIGALGEEEGVVGKTEEEGRLLLDLPHAVLDWWGVGVGNGVEVQRDDRDSVGKLLCKTEVSLMGNGRWGRKNEYAPTYFLAEYSE